MSNSKYDESAESLTPDEQRALRLFRCMGEGEQDEVLSRMAHTLMRRFSVDDLSHNTNAAELLAQELAPDQVEEYGSRLLFAWPGGWPDRCWVELDALNDPGYYLEMWLSGPDPDGSFLLGSNRRDRFQAELLAESYIEKARENCYPLPDEFLDGEPDELEATMYELVTLEFVAFLREWRERVIVAFERQADSLRNSRGD